MTDDPYPSQLRPTVPARHGVSEVSRRVRSVLRLGRHIASKTFEIAAGTAFLSVPGQALWRSRNTLAAVAAPEGIRCAMIAHIYYPELLEDVLECWRALPDGAPLHLTAPNETAAELRIRLSELHNVTVHAVENRGRDIAPFLKVLASGALDGFDAVAKLHTKRSPHLRTGSLRRRLLFTVLAGDRLQVRRVLHRFADPKTGLAGWRFSFRTRASYWHANQARVREIAARISPQTSADLAFFEGSMFWFRPAALEPLRRLALTAADFEPEAGQADGALHHAIERSFCLAARAAGYRTNDLTGRRLL